MRGAVQDLPSPYPLAAGLPAAFFGNDFTGNLVAAFDEMLAPIFATLDDLDAYLDCRYAPEDFLRWLGQWLGFPFDERWPPQRLRAHLVDAVEAVRWRGTVRGVAAAVRAYTGQEPTLQDSGGVSSSARPLGPLPGRSRPRLVVQVDDADGTLDPEVVSRLVAEFCPTHVPFEVLITGADDRPPVPSP